MLIVRAGHITEATPESGEWVFVDPGFSSKAKSCGLLTPNSEPIQITFAQLQAELVSLVTTGEQPLNLAIEAPLSVAFGPAGNPVGRSIELRNGQARYWYVGLGCSVLVAATYLLRAITDANPKREVRLFEGLVSFKPKGERSSHSSDVANLRRVVWGEQNIGRVIPPEMLAASPNDVIKSAFLVAGMNYGIPPVITVGG